MDIFVDRSKKPDLIEIAAEAASKLNETDLQTVCTTCGSLLGCISNVKTNKVNGNLVLSEISVLKEFFTSEELNSLLAWLGLAYDENNNILISLIEKFLMNQRMEEFVNRIRTRLPNKNYPDTAVQEISGTVTSAVGNLEKYKFVTEGTITVSAEGKPAVRLANGDLWHNHHMNYVLKQIPKGTYVQILVLKRRFIVMCPDS